MVARLVRPAVVLAFALVVACTGLAGVDDLRVEQGAGSDASLDASWQNDGTAGLDGSNSGSGGSSGGTGSSSGTGSGSGSSSGSSSGSTDAVADSTGCGGVCVAPAPAGWSGPFANWAGNPTSLPSCAGSWNGTPVDAFTGLDAPAATCTCSCDPATGQVCAPITVALFQEDSACSGTYACGGATLSPGCQAAGGPCSTSYTTYYKTSAPTAPTSGQCGSPHATTTTAPPSWTTATRLCPYSGANSGTGCNTGQSCMSVPSAPFGPLCIYIASAISCPPPYSVSSTYYQGTSGTRACTACTCTGPTGGSCVGGGGVIWSGTNSCFNGGQTSVGPGAGCSSTGFAGAGSVQGVLPTLTAGQCAANGGQPTGTTSPSSPITVCCTP